MFSIIFCSVLSLLLFFLSHYDIFSFILFMSYLFLTSFSLRTFAVDGALQIHLDWLGLLLLVLVDVDHVCFYVQVWKSRKWAIGSTCATGNWQSAGTTPRRGFWRSTKPSATSLAALSKDSVETTTEIHTVRIASIREWHGNVYRDKTAVTTGIAAVMWTKCAVLPR